jgi:hypothetical protein
VVISLGLVTLGATLTLITLQLARDILPHRQNFTGHRIPTAAGLIFLPIILLTLMATIAGWFELGLAGVGYLVYSLLAGIVGYVDDVRGGAEARGFRGHIGALIQGRVTTGAIKVFALGGGAVALGLLMFGVSAEAVFAAFLVAGCVNLANLLDLRPGRAIKFLSVPILALLFLAPVVASLAVLPILGGVFALFYFDLRGRIMLGDAGAAVLGAVPGYLVASCGPGLVWWVAAVVILGLTALAEVSSISRWIEEVDLLRKFDLWGRDNRD